MPLNFPPAPPFQFTCPSRSTTGEPVEPDFEYWVSIHVPLAEHDRKRTGFVYRSIVSIHVPLAEHDHRTDGAGGVSVVSIHVPLAEHDKNW